MEQITDLLCELKGASVGPDRFRILRSLNGKLMLLRNENLSESNSNIVLDDLGGHSIQEDPQKIDCSRMALNCIGNALAKREKRANNFATKLKTDSDLDLQLQRLFTSNWTEINRLHTQLNKESINYKNCLKLLSSYMRTTAFLIPLARNSNLLPITTLLATICKLSVYGAPFAIPDDSSASSKLRLHSLSCLFNIAQASPQALSAHWSMIIPPNEAGDASLVPNNANSKLCQVFSGSHFVPPDARFIEGTSSCLLYTLCFDPYAQARATSSKILDCMISKNKPFLQAAEEAVEIKRSFTPLSHTLGQIVREIHRHLFCAMFCEQDAQILALHLKCLSSLCRSINYKRMKSGYLRRIYFIANEFLPHTDIEITKMAFILLSNIFISATSTELFREFQENFQKDSTATILLTEKAAQLKITEALEYIHNVLKVDPDWFRKYWRSALEEMYTRLFGTGHCVVQVACLDSLQCVVTQSNELSLSDIHDLIFDYVMKKKAIPLREILLNGYSTTKSAVCTLIAEFQHSHLSQEKEQIKDLVALVVKIIETEQNQNLLGSALKFLGRILLAECIYRDSDLFDTISNVLLFKHSAKLTINVRLILMWSIANLASVISLQNSNLVTVAKCLQVAFKGCNENIKIQINAVRILGYIGSWITGISDPMIKDIIKHVKSGLSSESAKVCWNACVACKKILGNSNLVDQNCYELVVKPLISALCDVLARSVNFKTRINAVAALLTLSPREKYRDLYFLVCRSILEAFKKAAVVSNFNEYGYQRQLQTGLLEGLQKMLEMMEEKDQEKIRELLRSASADGLREYIEAATSTRGIYTFPEEINITPDHAEDSPCSSAQQVVCLVNLRLQIDLLKS